MGETCWGGKGCCQVSSPALHLISDSSPILIFLCCWSHRAQQQIIFPWCDDRCLVPLSRCLLSGPPLLSRPLQHGYTTRQHVECGKLYNHQKAAWRKSRYFDKADYDKAYQYAGWLVKGREPRCAQSSVPRVARSAVVAAGNNVKCARTPSIWSIGIHQSPLQSKQCRIFLSCHLCRNPVKLF